MVYINNQFDVTISPVVERPKLLTMEEAKKKNSIYRGNGLPCQIKMCQDLTGCSNCGSYPLNQDIVDFCGVNSTPGVAMCGGWFEVVNTPINEQGVPYCENYVDVTMYNAKQPGTNANLTYIYNSGGMYWN